MQSIFNRQDGSDDFLKFQSKNKNTYYTHARTHNYEGWPVIMREINDIFPLKELMEAKSKHRDRCRTFDPCALHFPSLIIIEQ